MLYLNKVWYKQTSLRCSQDFLLCFAWDDQ